MRRDFPYEGDESCAVQARRLKRVLRLAAEKSGWGSPLPPGRARGIAVHYTFGSYAAEVAEVSVDAHKRLRVHRVVAAIDVGLPVNPLNLEAQTARRHHRRPQRGDVRRDHDRSRRARFRARSTIIRCSEIATRPRSKSMSFPAASIRPASAKLRCRRSRRRWRTRSSPPQGRASGGYRSYPADSAWEPEGHTALNAYEHTPNRRDCRARGQETKGISPIFAFSAVRRARSDIPRTKRLGRVSSADA